MRLRNIPRADEVISHHPMVIKPDEHTKGSWSEIFGNSHPIHMEIGMGKGQFLMTLAGQNPDINYVGIERYTSVLLRAVEKLDEEETMPNLRFLNLDAANVEDIFSKGEVQKIYLNFSDPWPKARHARRRLTSTAYWTRYEKLLEPGSVVEFKTDNQELFAFSLESLEEAPGFNLMAQTRDLHHDDALSSGNVMTEYEEKFSGMGHPICKLIAVRTGESQE